MSGHIAVVTDSTAYLPPDLAEGVTVVPLHVILDGTSYSEGVDIDGDRTAQALHEDRAVTTSRPSPEAFLTIYRDLVAGGAAGIVSVHLSAEMSGTVQAARIAAGELGDVPVTVLDSRSLGMAMGFGVVDAARLAAAGAGLDEVAKAAARRALHSSAYMYVDTLEHLRRGGRIGAAQAWLGSALSVKPLLHLVDGRLEPLERVRTSERALTRLVEVALADAGDRAVDLAVHHLAAAERAESVAERLRTALPEAGRVVLAQVGGVVGAHVGPGMVAVVVSPQPN